MDEVKESLHRRGRSSQADSSKDSVSPVLSPWAAVLLLDEPTSALIRRQPAYRGVNRAVEGYGFDYSRDSQHGPSGPRFRLAAFVYLGELFEFGPSGRCLLPEGQRTEEYLTGKFG